MTALTSGRSVRRRQARLRVRGAFATARAVRAGETASDRRYVERADG